MIVFEGLSCVGKTTAIGRLADDYGRAFAVAELLVALPDVDEPDRQYFIENDRRKSAAVAAAPSRAVGLVDRYYFSTIAYELALAGPVDSREYILGRYDAVFSELIVPDVVIHVDDGSDASWCRMARHRPALRGLWSSLSGLRRLELSLDDVLSTLSASLGFNLDRVGSANVDQAAGGALQDLLRVYDE